MVPSKHVLVNYESCRADECGSLNGGDVCPAVKACSPGVLVQEETDEPPMLPSPRMCVGCGDCVSRCVHDAIESSRR